jgi:DNA-directed RNA polymerase subunit RPC12/RpoP
MEHLTVEGVLGTTIVVLACLDCRAFWFEPFETLHLTPPSTLKLFRVIADRAGEPAPPFPTASSCPNCNSRLLLTHDRQHNTSFQYWRCDRGHGRFTAFIDFLREKDFVRPLSPQQMHDLRQQVQMINCSNCGAPVDLTRDTICAHCGASVSMLDTSKLQEIAQSAGRPAPSLPAMTSAHEPGGAPPFPSHASDVAAQRQDSSFNLIELGLQGVAQWLRDLAE